MGGCLYVELLKLWIRRISIETNWCSNYQYKREQLTFTSSLGDVMDSQTTPVATLDSFLRSLLLIIFLFPDSNCRLPFARRPVRGLCMIWSLIASILLWFGNIARSLNIQGFSSLAVTLATLKEDTLKMLWLQNKNWLTASDSEWLKCWRGVVPMYRNEIFIQKKLRFTTMERNEMEKSKTGTGY